MAANLRLVYSRNDASDDALERFGDWYHLINDSAREFAHLAFQFGFKSYAIVTLDKAPDGRSITEVVQSNLDPLFLEHIVDGGDLDRCSIFQVLSESCVPFGWNTGSNVFSGKTEPSDLTETDLMFDKLLEAFDIEGGYCVPVHQADGSRAVVIYLGPACADSLHFPTLVLKTTIVFEGAIRANGPFKPAPRRPLGSLEKVCLEGFAKGGNAHEVARQLNLSEHTVNLLVQKLKNDLHAKSLAQAIRLATDSGLIDKLG